MAKYDISGSLNMGTRYRFINFNHPNYRILVNISRHPFYKTMDCPSPFSTKYSIEFQLQKYFKDDDWDNGWDTIDSYEFNYLNQFKPQTKRDRIIEKSRLYDYESFIELEFKNVCRNYLKKLNERYKLYDTTL